MSFLPNTQVFKKNIKRHQDLFLLILFGCVLIGVNWEVFHVFWKLDIIGGWDGTGHAAIGEYYAKNIFPKTWGWAPHWYAGMPFPQFYTPLFHIIVSTLYTITPFEYSTVLKIFLTCLNFILPGLLAWTTRVKTQNIFAGIGAGIITIFLLSLDSWGMEFGISLRATFGSGIFTQLLGFICLIVWFHFFLEAEYSFKANLLSIFFLFLTLIANTFIVPIAAILFFVTIFCRGIFQLKKFTVRKFFSWIFQYFLRGLIPFLLAAFWYVPMLTYFQYLTSQSLPPNGINELFFAWIPLWIGIVISMSIGFYKKQQFIIIIGGSCLMIFLLVFSQIDRIFQSLPIQPFRFMASFFFLAPILIGHVVGNITKFWKPYWKKFIVFIICIVLFMTSITGQKTIPFGVYLNQKKEHINEIISYLKGKQGRVNVEVFTDIQPSRYKMNQNSYQPSYHVLNSMLGKEGIDTSYIVFRESSISSLFMTPIRNSFSQDKEVFGIQTFLAGSSSFLSQDVEKDLDRAKFMGIKYFLITSKYMIDELSKSPRVILDKDFGVWKLFKIVEDVPFVTPLKYEPVLFFGPATFKKRHVNEYDYVHFQEELFFNDKFDTLITHSTDPFLDKTPDLDYFKIILLSEYKYHDINQAFERLKKYSENNHIVLIFDEENQLAQKLKDLSPSHNIHIFNKDRGRKSNVNTLRIQMQYIFNLLEEIKIPIPQGLKTKEALFSKNNIKVTFEKPIEKPIPILVKSSYFPGWKRTDGESIYITTPTFILTYAQNDFDLVFETTNPVKIGFFISLLTIVSGSILTLVFYQKNSLK